ncbi:hypothetical protein GCM10017673_00100 [Streptosporangium violaceochromogenes]|nr:hypothetical protein GCM10017673_00100 [Streptosporangium violaceochromogenes]
MTVASGWTVVTSEPLVRKIVPISNETTSVLPDWGGIYNPCPAGTFSKRTRKLEARAKTGMRPLPVTEGDRITAGSVGASHEGTGRFPKEVSLAGKDSKGRTQKDGVTGRGYGKGARGRAQREGPDMPRGYGSRPPK